jgi:hypothetical protein
MNSASAREHCSARSGVTACAGCGRRSEINGSRGRSIERRAAGIGEWEKSTETGTNSIAPHQPQIVQFDRAVTVESRALTANSNAI